MKMKFDENRTYGVEIEINNFTKAEPEEQFDRQELSRRLREKGIKSKVTSYWDKAPEGYWDLTTDSSCGYEVVSPILKGRDGLKEIETVCEVLDEMGAKADHRCGLHVHHDVNDLSVDKMKEVFTLYTKFEGTIDSLVPKSRREDENAYCGTNRRYSLNRLRNCSTTNDLASFYSNRYIKLNFQSYVRYGTLEFRQHEGTINSDEIINWVKFTQLFLSRAKREEKVTIPDEINHSSDNYRMMKRALKMIESRGADEEVKEVTKFYNKKRKRMAS